MGEKLISVENFGVEFNGRNILKDVSFDIFAGDVVAIIGPNGAGKTLLLRSLLGLDQDYAGSITWHSRPETSYVPQKMFFEKNFPLTVKEFFLLEMGRQDSFWLPSAQTVAEIENRLKEVRIPHLINARLGDLSQGEVQRMFIARSLLENPGIIFFDEPAAGIDIGSEETIYNLLYDIYQKKGLTMILVSHELSVVYRFATKVICLNNGLLCQGTPTEVLTPETMEKLYGHHTALHQHQHNHDENITTKEITDQHDHS